MPTWLTATLLTLALLQGAMVVVLLRRTTEQLAIARVTHAEVLTALDVVRAARLEIAAAQHGQDRLREQIEQLAATPVAGPTPWIGAFLPTDAGAAQLERQTREAEDHAISAGGPTRFSPGPTRSSERPSGRGGSRPAARSSGGR
jgi:hypothetical protein